MSQTRNRLDSMTNDARQGYEDAVSMASDGGRRAARAVGEWGSAAQHAGEMVADRATRQIRDYPMATVFAAAALGLFTGFLLSRR